MPTSNARQRRDPSRTIETNGTRPLRNRPSRTNPEPVQTGPTTKQSASKASDISAADEESRREVATILARVKGKTATHTRSSSLEDEAPPVAVPVGATERARDYYRSQKPPPSTSQVAAPPIPKQSDFRRQEDVSHQRDARFAVDLIEEAEEEKTLRAHEIMLREQMEAVAQRQALLKYKRLEATLREATAQELRTQQDHLANELHENLRKMASSRAEEEKQYHELKGQLSAQIEELCTLYETVSVQERECSAKRDAEEVELRRSASERVALMEAAAEDALRSKLAEEVPR